jgi:hypothetical protein
MENIKKVLISSLLLLSGCHHYSHLIGDYYISDHYGNGKLITIGRQVSGYAVNPKIDKYIVDKDNYIIYGLVVTPNYERTKGEYYDQRGYFFIDAMTNKQKSKLDINEIKEILDKRNIEFKL